MPIIPGDLVECAVYCQQEDQLAVNVLHYRCSGTSNPSAPDQDVADALAAYFQPLYKPLMNTLATFLGVATRKTNAPPFGAYYYGKNNGGGTVAGDSLPKQVAGLISLRTNLGGPANRGRVYVPFPCEADSSSAGRPVSGYMTNLAALATAIINTGNLSLGGGGLASFQNVIFHRAFVSFTDVDHVVTPRKWANQRRRGDFGRPNKPPDGLV